MLLSQIGVSYYTTENTVKSLLTDYFLIDHFRVYPMQISTQEIEAEDAFERISRHIERLPRSFGVCLVDSVTNLVTHTKETGILDFFLRCKELCDAGRTIFMVVHSYAFEEGMLIRVRSLCDAHLRLRLEEVGERLVKVMEVSKVRNAERTTGNIISFEVEPGMGMRILPITKARA